MDFGAEAAQGGECRPVWRGRIGYQSASPKLGGSTRGICEHSAADPAASRRPGQPHADLQALGPSALQTYDPRGNAVDQDHEADLTDGAVQATASAVMKGDELPQTLRRPCRGTGITRHYLTDIGVGQR